MMSESVTSVNVKCQIAALGSERFEVGLLDAKTDRMLIREWDRLTLIKAIPFMRHKNREGSHIYIRPVFPHGLVLVDDLKAPALTRMKQTGYQPACIIETSPSNYQAWLKHGETLTKMEATQLAKSLAMRFDGDPSSADWRHFGRLCGFVNCKEKYRQENGLFPFSRLSEATGILFDQAISAVADARRTVAEERAKNHQRQADLTSAPSFAEQSSSSWRNHLRSIDDFRSHPRYGGDLHRADIAFAVYALSHHISEADIAQALVSRDLTHKGNLHRQDDYIDRTLAKAREHISSRSR